MTILLEKKIRESNFELLRIVSQYFIVLYHVLLLFISPARDNLFFKAVQIPLHIGVVVFVLLSGYFTIKASSRGLIRLMGIFFIYSIPEIIFNIWSSESLKEIIHSCMFFSFTHFWFVKQYVFLFLLSPMINAFLKNSSSKGQIYLIICLAFISIYGGTFGADASLNDGKNIANFLLIYCCGYYIKTTQSTWNKISLVKIVVAYSLFNGTILGGYMIGNDVIRNMIWRFCFPYSSLGMLANSVLFFLIFAKIPFKSKMVNYAALSCFAIYLLHGNRPYVIGFIGLCAKKMVNYFDNDILIMGGSLLLTFFVILFAIIVDKLLTPIWTVFEKCGAIVYKRLGV